jgi:hypothetical protein
LIDELASGRLLKQLVAKIPLTKKENAVGMPLEDVTAFLWRKIEVNS